MNNQLTTIENNINALEVPFNELATGDLVSFRKEAMFAIQLMQKNNFLMTTAQNNPESMKNAVLNIASIGLSLNPAKAHAYLVPRDGMVCLDVSYRGFIELAVASTAIEFVQARIAYEKDTFEYRGIKEEPMHRFDSFGDRGKIVGVYCVAKTAQGDYLSEMMSLDECYDIRDRSKAWKSGKRCPWRTDEGEMLRKTVIKRASKFWPQVNNRMSSAIDLVNQHEGIDFQQEQAKSIESAKERNEELKKEAENKRELIEEITALSSIATNGWGQEEKIEFMQNTLKVNNFDNLKKKSVEFLRETVETLKENN